MTKSIDSDDIKRLRGYMAGAELAPLTVEIIRSHVEAWIEARRDGPVDDENPAMTATIAEIRDEGVAVKPPGGKIYVCSFQEIISSDAMIRSRLAEGMAPRAKDFREGDDAIGVPPI